MTHAQQIDDFQSQQEQERDVHRAEQELSEFLEKVDSGMATHSDVVNARYVLAFFGINANKSFRRQNGNYRKEDDFGF